MNSIIHELGRVECRAHSCNCSRFSRTGGGGRHCCSHIM